MFQYEHHYFSPTPPSLYIFTYLFPLSLTSIWPGGPFVIASCCCCSSHRLRIRRQAAMTSRFNEWFTIKITIYVRKYKFVIENVDICTKQRRGSTKIENRLKLSIKCTTQTKVVVWACSDFENKLLIKYP